MKKPIRRRSMLSTAFALFVMFFMSVSAFAGAVDVNTSTSGNSTPAIQASPDSPGSPDSGSDIQVDSASGDNAEGTDLTEGGLAYETDYATKERLAKKVLGGGDKADSQAEEGEIQFADSLLSNDGLANYQNTLFRTLGESMDAYRDSMKNAMVGSSLDSSESSDLYDAVNEYLNNNNDGRGYVPYSDELIAKGFSPDREVVEERTESSKMYRNDDGTFTAAISEKPMHYRDSNGEFQDIDLTIVPTLGGEYGYKSVKNTLRSFFSTDYSPDTGVTVDIDGRSGITWTPVNMVYKDQYELSHNIGGVSESTGTVSGNVITYRDTFPATTEEFMVNNDHLKHNLILSELPDSAAEGLYLSYVGKITLADGLALYVDGYLITEDTETFVEIEVRNSNGDIIYVLPPPVAFEFNNLGVSVEGSYSIDFEDDGIFLSLNTPVAWLKDPARVYPIVVDPNIFVTIDSDTSGYAYHYYRRYYSSITESWYYYTTGTYRYLGFYGYSYGTYYEYRITRRSWIEWNTSVIPDSYTVKQIDFHGRNWYNSYSAFTVNIREPGKDPKDYSSSSSTAKRKEFFNGLASGRIYNASVTFPRSYWTEGLDVYALGGTANQDMQDNLTKNRFILAFHKVIESSSSTGYGYFNLNKASYAQLYVVVDPCPRPPIPDTGGPYFVPEGTNGVWLDASATFSCGSSVMYYWDINDDGTYDLVSSLPKVFWNKNFPDDWSGNLTLMVRDLTYRYSATAKTTITVYNVNPKIITPSTPIVGYEGQTLNLPKIEFTDPGTLDTHTYAIDFNGDNVPDKTGSTIKSGGKLYVPSTSYYFCDDTDSINVTVTDKDGGYSDSIEQAEVEPIYDGDIRTYKRPAMPSRDYTYRYMSYTSSYYPYMYVQKQSYVTSYDYEYRGLIKFDASSLPSTFTATNVTLRTYLAYVSAGGKMGVNDLSNDPYYSSTSVTWADADTTNILESGNYVDISTSDSYSYQTMYLQASDFNDEVDAHSRWYGVAFDSYDPNDDNVYFYFYGGTYTTLTVTDGTSTYTLRSYSSWTTRNGMHGYIYQRSWPARDLMWREDSDTIMYVEDYKDSYYNSEAHGRSFVKFGPMPVDSKMVIGADINVYMSYIYNYYSTIDIKIGINDLNNDPEVASDSAVFTDAGSSNIFTGTEWEPDDAYTTYNLDLVDSDIVSKLKSHGSWYGVGFKKNSGTVNRYAYMATMEYSSDSYKPKLLVDYRVPFQFPVDVKNLDPVLDLSNMVVSPTTVKEGDTVTVTGVKYSDAGPCDTHSYRVVVPLGAGKNPLVVKDWAPASNGSISFSFKAPDDDPEDGDSDISKDVVDIQIEIADDDFVPNFHYKAITLELNHYEYYMYSWYKDWGVYQNLQPWDEMTVTWSNYPRSYAKSTAEDTVAAHGDHSYTPGYGYHWDAWDVTSIVKKWMAGTENNYGLRIQPVTAGKDPNEQFSSDYSSASRRPILRIEPLETTASDYILQPGPSEGKDALLRNSPYHYNNYGTYSYLTYTYDYPYYYYPESAGMIEFDLSNAPPETDENGIGRGKFQLTISNVAPVLDETAYKIKNSLGEDVTAVKEGEDFMVTNIVFDDPAAGYETEVFEYRVDWGSGTPSAWALAKTVTPGGTKVVPNAYENSNAPSYTSSYFGYYYYSSKQYLQWLDASQFGGEAKVITEIQWQPTWYYYYQQYAWTATFTDLKIYLSHKTGPLTSNVYADNYGFDRTLVKSGSFSWYHPSNSADWMGIPLDTNFVYDGESNLVINIVYTGYSVTSTYPYAACMFQYEYSSSVGTMIYSYDATSPTGYGPYTNTYKYRFIFDDSFTEPYGIIPPIQYAYPDDHPSSGTPSDVMDVEIEIRDDDGGTHKGNIEITVENVDPSIDPGNLLVNGNPSSPNVLLVFDSYASYNPVDWVDALKANGQRGVVKPATGMTLTEMNKYDLVIWMKGGEAVRYTGTTERTLITNYISGGGKLLLSGTYWYNYYSWASAFNKQFGIQSYTYTYYIGTSGTVDIEGTGSISGTDTYTLSGSHDEIYGYYYYMSMARLNGGTSDFVNPSYTSGSNIVMAHKDDASTGAQAMMWGFDINQIDELEDQAALMADVLTYFGIEPRLMVEIDEGDEVSLEDFDIVDPAEGVPTETFQYYVDWGDGQVGPTLNVSGGIAPALKGNYAVAPSAYENSFSGVGLRLPLEVSFGSSGQRYQQLNPSSELGGDARTIKAMQVRNWIASYSNTAWTNTYTNFKMYFSHATSTSLSTTFANNFGKDRTLVYSRSLLTISNPGTTRNWINFPLDTNFNYDGSSDLIVDIQWAPGTFSRTYGGVVDYGYLTGMMAVGGLGTNPGTAIYTQNNAGIVLNFTFTSVSTTPGDPAGFTHMYRDDPSGTDDTYKGIIHVMDDDKGEGTLEFFVRVNNIRPEFDANFVPTPLTGVESGSPNVLTPEIPFWDRGTQYDVDDPNEIWTFWFDCNDNGVPDSADYIGTVPQSKVTETNDESFGKIPAVKLTYNDNYRGAVSVYLFDDDDEFDNPEYMTANQSAANHVRFPSVTVSNSAPKATVSAHIPMEVRLRMTGRAYHDIKVIVTQTNPNNANDQIVDTITMERMPGQPKANPTSDGKPFSPFTVEVLPYMDLELKLIYDARPDANDPVHPQDKDRGSNSVNVFLDFPMEKDYDPRDDDQSVAGHHWNKEFKFNANENAYEEFTFDISDLLEGKQVALIGTSFDDASDDNSFNWNLVSGTFNFAYTAITYYNDGSDPVVNGPWRDMNPSPFNGTAPIMYTDVHTFVYTSAFTIQLVTKDDDGGVSPTATFSLPAP